MHKKVILLLLAILIVTLATSCWDLRIIEDLSLGIGLGIDQDTDDLNKIRVSFNAPALAESAETTMGRTTVQAYSIGQALQNIQRQRERIVALGKLRVLVFDENSARSGKAHEVILELGQQQDMNPNTLLVVVEGAPTQHVLNIVPPEQSMVGVYIGNVIQRNYDEGLIPMVTANSFWTRYSAHGINPVLPLIKLAGGHGEPGSEDQEAVAGGQSEQGGGGGGGGSEEQAHESIIIAGLAVFNARNEMVGKVTDQEVYLYMLLAGEPNRTQFHTLLDFEEQRKREAVVNVNKVNSKITTTISGDIPRIDIRMRLDLSIVDVGIVVDDQLDEEVFSTLEEVLARDISNNALNLIERTQFWESDIFGFGRHVRVQHPHWFRGKEWSDYYLDAKINLEVEVNLRRLGTLINPRF
jgi:Ger(x)C family germination protein